MAELHTALVWPAAGTLVSQHCLHRRYGSLTESFGCLSRRQDAQEQQQEGNSAIAADDPLAPYIAMVEVMHKAAIRRQRMVKLEQQARFWRSARLGQQAEIADLKAQLAALKLQHAAEQKGNPESQPAAS